VATHGTDFSGGLRLSAMSEFHSLGKVVKETRTSTCTRIILVEGRSNGVAVKVNEHSTDWARPFPNTSPKVSFRRCLSLEDADAYASDLLEASLEDGFFRAF
jgi:hypothetical protein